jgi:HEAT repeat protein
MGFPSWLERARRLLARVLEHDDGAREPGTSRPGRLEASVRESLRSPRAEVREGALRLLLSQQAPCSPREELQRLLGDPEPSVRHLAAVLLGEGPEVPGLWEVVVDAAREGEPSVRQRAMARLGALGGQEPARSAKAVRVLEEALDRGTRADVRAALGALGQLARKNEGAVEVLIHAFSSMPEDLLEDGMFALRPLQGMAEGMIPRLLALLEDPRLTGVRRGCVLWWLGECARGGPSPQVVELLVREFWSPSGAVIESAVEALCRCEDIQDALRPRLLEALEDPKLGVLGRFGVAVVLGHFGEPVAIPHLVSLLEMHDTVFPVRTLALSSAEQGLSVEKMSFVKYRAVRVLGAFGRRAERAAPALLLNLLVGSRVLQKEAAEALTKMGLTRGELESTVLRLRERFALPERESKALRELLARAPELPREEVSGRLKEVLAQEVAALRNEGASLTVLVGAVLDAPEPERAVAIERLRRVLERRLRRSVIHALPSWTVKLLDSPESAVRLLGAQLLDAARTPAAIPGLRRGLGDADERIRAACVSALRGVGLEPSALIEHLRSERAEEREAALELVSLSARAELRPELRRLLEDPAAPVRHLAAERLDVEPAVPGVWEVTLDAVRRGRSPYRRSEAIRRLRRFGLRPEAAPVLIEALGSDEDESVRGSAASALGELAPEHGEVAEALLRALRDASSDVGQQAASSLARRGATTEAVVPRLLAAVEDPELAEAVRGQVMVTLAELGERAVVPALLRVLEQPDDAFRIRGDEVTGLGTEPWLKLEAVRALGGLGPLAAEAVPVLLASFRASPRERQLAMAEALERMGAPRAELEALLREVLPGAEG